MKLLLDENLPVKLKYRFLEAGLATFTVRDMQWQGKKNGELLRLMQQEDFTTFLTIDNNISYQQNFTKYPVRVLVLIAQDNVYDTIMGFFPVILQKLQEDFTGTAVVIHPEF